MNDSIKNLLAADPLAEAERITGKSYKEDHETTALGLLLHMANADAKRSALSAAGDTHFNSTFVEQLAVMERLGFREVLRDPFTAIDLFDGHKVFETFVVMWHEDGLLATVESYNGSSRNTAKVWYNVRPHNQREFWNYTSSGGYTDGIWCGDHDIREGVASKINGLREHGDFLPVWTSQPFLWLLTYADTKGDYDHKAINAARLSRLPEDVRKAVLA